MKALMPLAALVALGACMDSGPSVPPSGTAVIEVASGGAFSGVVRTSIYANDVLIVVQTDMDGKHKRSVVRGDEGVYQAALAVVLDKGPQVAAQVSRKTPGFDCQDYGSDSITVSPPIDGFSAVSANCPERKLLDLQTQILNTLPAAP